MTATRPSGRRRAAAKSRSECGAAAASASMAAARSRRRATSARLVVRISSSTDIPEAECIGRRAADHQGHARRPACPSAVARGSWCGGSGGEAAAWGDFVLLFEEGLIPVLMLALWIYCIFDVIA